MHLCPACRTARDWENDPAVKAKIDLNLQQSDENRRARCGTCRAYIRNPLFQLCAKCAEKAEQCQHCTASTLTPEARAAREAAAARRDELVDLFTLAVKTYGLTVSRRLVRELRGQLADAEIEMLALLDHRDIDIGRERRPIWTKALGTNVYRLRFCADCTRPAPHAPAIVPAGRCGHWTTARSSSYCPPCAADHDACEACGTPHDALVD